MARRISRETHWKRVDRSLQQLEELTGMSPEQLANRGYASIGDISSPHYRQVGIYHHCDGNQVYFQFKDKQVEGFDKPLLKGENPLVYWTKDPIQVLKQRKSLPRKPLIENTPA